MVSFAAFHPPLFARLAILMSVRSTIVSFAALGALAIAFTAHAQLTLRGDYAAARGITELSALYAKEHKTSVVVTPFSTNAGIEGVLKGEIDVAASARPPVASRPAERDLVFWPVAWDAVVFIVHPSNPVSGLTVAQLRDIYMGRLSNWNEIGGRNAPIDLYSVMGPYDGLEASMRQMLFANPGYNAKIKRLFLNQHQIEVGIQMDPDAIGMTTLAGLSKQKVKALTIEGIAADKDTVAAGRYLLTVPLYMVYRADNPKAAEITRFAEFLRTPIAESVIVNKRLVPHREDEDFKAMHAARLTALWTSLGGEPMPAGAVRFTADATAGGAPAVATSVATTPSSTAAAATPAANTPVGPAAVDGATAGASPPTVSKDATTPAAASATPKEAAPAAVLPASASASPAQPPEPASSPVAEATAPVPAPDANGAAGPAPKAGADADVECDKASPTDKC
jgi:phosphate transport system substrate-binding protein